MKKLVSICMMLFLCLGIYAQKSYQLLSPNGEIKMSISVTDKIYNDIAYGQETLMENGIMQLGKQVLGENPKESKASTQSVDEIIRPVIPFKFSNIRNHYNQLLLKFNGNY